MPQSPKFEQFRTKYLRAIDAGLIARAYVYRNELVTRLMNGYTTGDFVTPDVALRVMVGEPHDKDGVRRIVVGIPAGTPSTDGGAGPAEYAVFWELGHFNLFTGRYERVEHWRESMLATRAEQEAAFYRAFNRTMGTA